MARTYEQLVNYKTDDLMPYISFGSFLGLDDNVTTAPTDEASAESEGKQTLFEALFNHTQFELDDNGLVSITGQDLDLTHSTIGFATKAEQDINGKDIIKYISNINGNDVDGYDFILGDDSVLKHIAGMPNITVTNATADANANIKITSGTQNSSANLETVRSAFKDTLGNDLTKYFKEVSFDNNNKQLIFTKGDNTTQTVAIPTSSGEGGGTVTGGSLTVTNATASADATIKLNLNPSGGDDQARILGVVKKAIQDKNGNDITEYVKSITYNSTSGVLSYTKGDNNSVDVGTITGSGYSAHLKGLYKSSSTSNTFTAVDSDRTRGKGFVFAMGDSDSTTGSSLRFLSNVAGHYDQRVSPNAADYVVCLSNDGEPYLASIQNINSTSTSIDTANFASYANKLTSAGSSSSAGTYTLKNGIIQADNSGNLSAYSTTGNGLLRCNNGSFSWDTATYITSASLAIASVNYATSAGFATSASFASYAKYLTSGTSSDYSSNKLTNGIIKADSSGNLSAISAPSSNLIDPNYALLRCTSTGTYDWITPNNICAGALWGNSSIISDGVIVATSTGGPGSTGGGAASAGISAIVPSSSSYGALTYNNGTYGFTEIFSTDSKDYVLTYNSGSTNKLSWKTITIPASVTIQDASDNNTNNIYYLCGTTRSNGSLNNDSSIFVSNTSPYFKNGGLYQTSDENLKTFVRDLDVDLDKLATIKKGLFYWKSDNSQTLNLGITAQSIEILYPQIVTRSDEGVAAVSYSKLGVIALAAIDKLNQRIKELEAEVKYLKSK